MATPIIEVEGLSKLYRLGATVGHDTLRDTIAASVRSLLGRTKRSAVSSDDLWALRDVSFEVQQGEVLGIIGRNGAGKSTLLKILSRITDPTSGTARIRGRVASLLEVGTGFHPELTGRENIFLNGAILGMKKDEIKAKFDEIVAFAEVDRFLDTPVKRYSSGMYVRLAFAVAAHIEPEILIVDEVLAVGDAAFQKKCLGKMQDVSGGGRTVLFVSHNMAAVQRLCTRSLLLDGGSVASAGSTEDVVDLYISGTQEVCKDGALDMLPRPGELGRDIRIKRCQLLNSSGKPCSALMFGEPFSFSVEAESRRDLEDLSVVFGIDSLDGFRITTVLSEDSDALCGVNSGGTLRAAAHIDNLTLKPGRYLFTAGIRRGAAGLDHVVNAGRIEVAEAAYGGQSPASPAMGAVYTQATWTTAGPEGMI